MNRYLLFAIWLLAVLSVAHAQAGTVKLQWGASRTNTEGAPVKDMAGYRVYWGEQSRIYTQAQDVVGNVTTTQVSGLHEGIRYYFAVTAFDQAGNESGHSNEVTAVIRSPAPPAISLMCAGEIHVKPGPDGSHEVRCLPDPLEEGIEEAPAKLPVADVSASGHDGNVPANTLDGQFTTRWSALGKDHWIAYDLGQQQTVSQVAIAWYAGKIRRSTFAIEVSVDGKDWTKVHSGQSSGTTDELEPYSFSAVAARYVRIVGQGNTQSHWNSILEIEILG